MTTPTTYTELLSAIADRLGVSADGFGVSAAEPGDPMPWVVYAPDDGDILGAGMTLVEAAADAWRTVSRWGQ